MKPVYRIARGAVGLIVILLTGCDNVNWGGVDLAVVPPPPTAAPSETPAGPEPAAGVEPLPQDPILYYVARTAAGSFMTPVGLITGDTLTGIRAAGDARTYAERFIAEFMRQGTEFTLFSGGRRAGTFIVQTATLPDGPACPLLPTATGQLELSTGLRATEFLAVARADAANVQQSAARVDVPNRLRIVAPILAERMIRVRGASLPGNWQRALAQLTAFPLANQPNPGFTATFLVGDTLGPGLNDEGYALFYIGVPTASQTGYDTTYVSFRNYPETGKAAPRVIDFLDWNGDGSAEILMQAYGVASTWFEAVGNDARGGWHRIFDDRCDQGGRIMPTPAPVPPDPAQP